MAKILIVDDSPTEVHILRSALVKYGHNIVTATSGEEALEVARIERPDLILMDVVMPGMNGFQATRKLSLDPEMKSIPVIVVSNKSQETDRIWGIRQGAKDYLTKPVSEATLIESVRKVLGGSGGH
ncbi:MAG: response regulator [Gammaproteobacteria bacterium]|jgi:twitching motility two-component system response regulator PilH|nr:response regulator [Gammaproteobacteria bacterium]